MQSNAPASNLKSRGAMWHVKAKSSPVTSSVNSVVQFTKAPFVPPTPPPTRPPPKPPKEINEGKNLEEIQLNFNEQLQLFANNIRGLILNFNLFYPGLNELAGLAEEISEGKFQNSTHFLAYIFKQYHSTAQKQRIIESFCHDLSAILQSTEDSEFTKFDIAYYYELVAEGFDKKPHLLYLIGNIVTENLQIEEQPGKLPSLITDNYYYNDKTNLRRDVMKPDQNSQQQDQQNKPEIHQASTTPPNQPPKLPSKTPAAQPPGLQAKLASVPTEKQQRAYTVSTPKKAAEMTSLLVTQPTTAKPTSEQQEIKSLKQEKAELMKQMEQIKREKEALEQAQQTHATPPASLSTSQKNVTGTSSKTPDSISKITAKLNRAYTENPIPIQTQLPLTRKNTSSNLSITGSLKPVAKPAASKPPAAVPSAIISPSPSESNTSSSNVKQQVLAVTPPQAPPLPVRDIQNPIETNNNRRGSVHITAVLSEKFANDKPVLNPSNPGVKKAAHTRSASDGNILKKTAAKPAASSAQGAKKPAAQGRPQSQVTVPVDPPTVTPTSAANPTTTTVSSIIAPIASPPSGIIKAAAGQASQHQPDDNSNFFAPFLTLLGFQTEAKSPQTVEEQLTSAVKNLDTGKIPEAVQQAEQNIATDKLSRPLPEVIADEELKEKLAEQKKKTDQITSLTEETTKFPSEENRRSDESQLALEANKKATPIAIATNQSGMFQPAKGPMQEEKQEFLKYSRQAEQLSRLYTDIAFLSHEIGDGKFQQSKAFWAYALLKVTQEQFKNIDNHTKQILKKFIMLLDKESINPNYRLPEEQIVRLAMALYIDLKNLKEEKKLDLLVTTLTACAQQQQDISILVALSGYYANGKDKTTWENMLSTAQNINKNDFNLFLTAVLHTYQGNPDINELSEIISQSSYKGLSPS